MHSDLRVGAVAGSAGLCDASAQHLVQQAADLLHLRPMARTHHEPQTPAAHPVLLSRGPLQKNRKRPRDEKSHTGVQCVERGAADVPSRQHESDHAGSCVQVPAVQRGGRREVRQLPIRTHAQPQTASVGSSRVQAGSDRDPGRGLADRLVQSPGHARRQGAGLLCRLWRQDSRIRPPDGEQRQDLPPRRARVHAQRRQNQTQEGRHHELRVAAAEPPPPFPLAGPDGLGGVRCAVHGHRRAEAQPRHQVELLGCAVVRAGGPAAGDLRAGPRVHEARQGQDRLRDVQRAGRGECAAAQVLLPEARAGHDRAALPRPAADQGNGRLLLCNHGAETGLRGG
mmetsp:Transcript_23420/g.57871  ORF Transcript_23420/g.57871 Transcript_23420/m.57871 type:complete len:340 (+) Transcript_23420:175-1194(+)